MGKRGKSPGTLAYKIHSVRSDKLSPRDGPQFWFWVSKGPIQREKQDQSHNLQSIMSTGLGKKYTNTQVSEAWQKFLQWVFRDRRTTQSSQEYPWIPSAIICCNSIAQNAAQGHQHPRDLKSLFKMQIPQLEWTQNLSFQTRAQLILTHTEVEIHGFMVYSLEIKRVLASQQGGCIQRCPESDSLEWVTLAHSKCSGCLWEESRRMM